MVDTLVLGTSTLLCVGSTPTFGTMKLNIYAVVIVVGNIVLSMFLMNQVNTYQTRPNDTINQKDSIFATKIFDKN